jgi:hypothetical protein
VAFSIGEAEEAQLAGRAIPGYLVVHNDPTGLPELLDTNSMLTLGIHVCFWTLESSSCSRIWTSPTSTESFPSSRRKITSF